MRLADPKPGFCSSCYAASPERRFVDFESDFDGAPVLDTESGTIAMLPWSHNLGVHDDLYICEACIAQATELLGFKPELHQRQLTEIKRQDVRIGYWRERAERAEKDLEKRDGYIRELEGQLEFQRPKPPGRPRKVAA